MSRTAEAVYITMPSRCLAEEYEEIRCKCCGASFPASKFFVIVDRKVDEADWHRASLCPDCIRGQGAGWRFLSRKLGECKRCGRAIVGKKRYCPDCVSGARKNREHHAFFRVPVSARGRDVRGLPIDMRDALLREQPMCSACGYTTPKGLQGQAMALGRIYSVLQIHHIVPRQWCGLNTRANLIVLCPTCHRLAHRITSLLGSREHLLSEPGFLLRQLEKYAPKKARRAK